jgi:hypothetical protein
MRIDRSRYAALTHVWSLDHRANDLLPSVEHICQLPLHNGKFGLSAVTHITMPL